MSTLESPKALAEALGRGDRRALSKAITLIESTTAEDRARAVELLGTLPKREHPAFRLAITGPPGAGKSTLIDQLGLEVLASRQRLSVLTIDPSSRISGGSILGDKTRMSRLLAEPNVFVRPSPSGSAGGGVAERTREAMRLCEAAGFDVVMVETVGVGQGELAVRDMVDVCLVVLLAGAGDELTSIKRGVLEVGDVFVVNKADGAGMAAAEAARGMYASTLSMLLGSSSLVLAASGLTGLGMPEVWAAVSEKFRSLQASGELFSLRASQSERWFDELLAEEAVAAFLETRGAEEARREALQLVRQGSLDAFAAARRVLERLQATRKGT
ncbi:MAG: methylmalonyl Co-A mutase-associated GTPase MeaB [Polyangiaceae bacterium]|nr:methylmalonyl Co-A mutase-associated GTPase MeaB [Polyangiaceae bacterium]